MIMIANLQYAWTLFVKPLIADHHWKLRDVQFAFSIFVACQTWFMPAAGWVMDRIGPRVFMTVAGVICGIGWAALGQAASLPMLYAFYAAAGIGAVLVYCGSMGVALKWFPDRRGLAAGITAAAFGSGTALFIPFIARYLKATGYSNTFLYMGIAQGLVIILAAQFLRNPDPAEVTALANAAVGTAKPKVRSHGDNFTSAQMMGTTHFYLLYLMMLMMGIGGLMVTANLVLMADSFKISATALTIALSMNPIANGASRLFWGWVSDRMGREQTMVTAFLIQALALVSVPLLAHGSDTAFISCLAMVYFSWGEIYSLFPSLSADIFGTRYASTNYGFLYSTKGVAAIFGGGLAAMLFEKIGTWDVAFYGSSVLAVISALLAVVVIKMPLPRKDPAANLVARAAEELSARG